MVHDPNAKCRRRFDWRLPLFAAAGAVLLALPVELSGAFDLIEVFYFFVVAPIIILVLVIIGTSKRNLAVLSMVAVYGLVSFTLFMRGYDLRTTVRWLIESHGFKAEVLSHPATTDGELRHVEWDGWGWAGMDTDVYLVFDPSNSLSAAAKQHSHGNFSGIPCGVDRVRRLEKDWYSVVFYTDTDWSHCG